MEVAGWLFNLAISQAVFGFRSWITGDVYNAITYGWTFFRDIANIVIIGLFVFIAICLILGIKSYGQKSLVARVLIVAVLINFSFLFTRIVINFSNALAVQFAKVQPLDAQVTPAGATPPDIAGKFSTLMGAETFKQTGDTIGLIAKDNNSFWLALIHALFITITALGIAIVLLYGAILLIVRAVIFVFLMVTSSLAFATYLLPNWASSEFGWKAWWEALFRNAMLAPLMMMFLAITLQISQALSKITNPGGANSGSLGTIAAHPDDPKGISALLTYILVLGLLYGAIRISNRFSGAAGQFAWGITQPFANATVAWPSRSLGFLSRNTIGRGAAAIGKNFQDRAVAANIRNPGGTGQFVWDKLAQGVKSVAKRDFNAGNLTGIKSAQTKLGGFEGQQKRRSEAILERQKRTTPSKEELKISADALKKAREETVGGGDSRKKGEAYDANQKALEAAKKMEEAAKQQVDAASKGADAISKQIKTLETRHDAATPENKQVIEKEINRKKGDMEQARNAIARAESNARDQSTKVINLELDGRNLKDMLDKRAAELMPKGHEYVSQEKGRTFNEALENNAMHDAYKRFSNTLNRAAGMPIESDSYAQSFRKATKDALHHDEEKKPNEKLGKQIDKLTETIKQMAEQQYHAQSKTNEFLKEMRNDQRNRK